MLNWRRIVVGGLCVLAVSLVAAEEVSGRIELMRKGKSQSPDKVDLTQAVVWFEPAEPSTAATPRNSVMTTRNKKFEPRILVVHRGDTVRFPNQDPILHNVFSSHRDNRFDVGLYGPGEGRAHTFEHSGLVRVFCNVHHSMVGYVLVVDSPHWVRPEADGTFRLDLPHREGQLRIWHERADVESFSAARIPSIVRLDVTHPRVPRHLDKSGESYRRRKGDRYR